MDEDVDVDVGWCCTRKIWLWPTYSGRKVAMLYLGSPWTSPPGASSTPHAAGLQHTARGHLF